MNSQMLLKGPGALEKLSDISSENLWSKLFIVTGRDSFRLSRAEEQIKRMFAGKIVTMFNNFDMNPNVKDAVKGIDLFNSSDADAIIAIGGGSVIDMAKLINALSADRNNIEEYIKGKKNIEKTAVPLAAVPTTSGTGSEATHFAVVYIDKIKYSLADPKIIPDYVILDPFLTQSLPSYITGCTLMDAICQALESLWSVNSNVESARYAETAVKLILDSCMTSTGAPSLKTREKYQEAAYLAGKAINITKTTAAHALSYYLTSWHNIPHGHAVGILFGWVFEQNYRVNKHNCNDSRGVKYVKERLSFMCRLFSAKSEKDFLIKFYTLMKKLGLDPGAVNFTNNVINKLFSSVNIQRLKNNPVALKFDNNTILDFQNFYQTIYISA